MVGMQRQIINDPRIEKALDRLKAMGLRVFVLPESENEAFIFISLDSIIKLIERQIKYENKKLYIEQGQLVIRVWRT